MNEIDAIIDEVTSRYHNLEITKSEDTITFTENGIIFGKVKAHFTTDNHFIGWAINCLLKEEICSKLYPKTWECNKMINKVFNTQQDALTELIKFYTRGFKLLNRESECSH
jgi:hypothetical protein